MFWRNPYLIQERNPTTPFSLCQIWGLCFLWFSVVGSRGGHVKDTSCGLWSCLQHLYTRNTYTVPNIQHVHTCTKLSRYYSGCHNTVISCFVSIIYVQTNISHCLQSFIYSGVHFINKRKLWDRGKRKRGGRGFLGHDVLMWGRDVRVRGGGNDVPWKVISSLSHVTPSPSHIFLLTSYWWPIFSGANPSPVL